VLGWPFQWLGYEGDPSQPPILRALSALGPAYIKFGQIMSTRPDIVGPELARELAVLQDKLPPFPTEAARRAIETELGRPVDEVFADFEPPVAAASLAQVHRARLRETGQVVAVKVLRPGIERAFLRDVDAFYFAAGLIETVAPFTRRLRPSAVIEHFESVVRGELDLRMEASAAAEFRANTERDPGFRVPGVIWEASDRRVLTLEWVSGTNLGDLEALSLRGIDMHRLGERIIQAFLNQALRDGYFHADMHQGNLKLGPDGVIVALDFGIMGRIDGYTRRVYAEILYGFLAKDYLRVAEVHFEAGYVPPDRDLDAFAQALRSVAEPIFGQDATRISMAKLLAYLFEVTEKVRHGDADRAHPAAADHGGGRGGGALAQPHDQHVGGGAAGGRGLHPLEPRPRRDPARPRRDRAHPDPLRPAAAGDGAPRPGRPQPPAAAARAPAAGRLGLRPRRRGGRCGAGGARHDAVSGV
jgi:ubiquinone biosynthesis protein